MVAAMPAPEARPTDTRIFSTAECSIRPEQAEDREGVSQGPTEPPRPTEPIPNRKPENLTQYRRARSGSTG